MSRRWTGTWGIFGRHGGDVVADVSELERAMSIGM